MDKMTFASYKFKPSDVIEGLNRYFAEAKAFRNRRVPLNIRNGEVKPGNYYVLCNIVFYVCTPKIKECGYYYVICDPEEVVDVAINWLREEHDIFYTPGMKIEDVSRPDDTKDIFDTPRYKFLSILSAELGFRTIVGPGNADKTEDAIIRAVKCRNDELKNFRARRTDEEGGAEARKEFLRKLRCELGVCYPVVGSNMEEMEEDILERIGKLKEGNWPCENGVSFAAYMRKQFPKECEKWNVAPLDEGSVHDWVQYIFGVLDEWRKRALKAEEEKDAIYKELGLFPGFNDTEDVLASIKRLHEDRAKYKGMPNACYGASCGDNVLPCYRDTCNNPKAIRERDAAKDALFELRAKIREVYREIFDCSDGDPEGSDKENLEDILEEYRNVASALDDTTEYLCKAKNSLSDLKRKYTDEIKLVSSVRAERDSNRAKYLVFLDKLAKVLGVSYSNPNYIPAKEQDILRAVKTMSENYEATYRVLEDKCKDYDNLDTLYKSSLKLLGEYLTEAKDILGIDMCSKDAVTKAIKDLKSAYNNLRNDYDEVCEGHRKLEKDYEELGKAYSSVLKWNNSYADIRRLLEVPADADAGKMVNALNKLKFDCETCDRLRKNWYNRYESEHERANGEHKRAEKCFGEIAALKTQVASLERSLNAAANEQVGVEAFRNECRKLRDEKAKVIKALGQDIWDSCVE